MYLERKYRRVYYCTLIFIRKNNSIEKKIDNNLINVSIYLCINIIIYHAYLRTHFFFNFHTVLREFLFANKYSNLHPAPYHEIK